MTVNDSMRIKSTLDITEKTRKKMVKYEVCHMSLSEFFKL